MQILGNFGAFDRSKAEGATEAINLLFMALAFNTFFGVTRVIDSFVAGENPPQEKMRGIRFKKAGIYLLLTIAGQIIHSGGSQQQWWQPLEGAWSLLTTGFVVAAIGFFVAGFVPVRARETMGLENQRIARDLRLVSNWFLYAGVVLIFLSVFVFALLPRQDFAWFLFFTSTVEIVAGLGCIATFLGLRKLKNWARIVAMVLAAITAPFSWYVLWVLGFTDARRAFQQKVAAHAR
jgi:hypothetical protein